MSCITVKTNKVIAEYIWDDGGKKVSLSSKTEDKDFNKILDDVLNQKSYFDPKKDDIIESDSLNDWNGFLTKAVPMLYKAGFICEIE